MRYDPLIAEMTNTGFIDPRQPGEILDPSRWDEADLNELRSQLGSVAYAQQYQQVVAPAEGAAFKRDNLKLVTRIPELTHQIRAWDLAKSTSSNADFTAGVKVGLGVDGNYYILDAVHFRLNPSEVTTKIVEVARLDGPGVGVRFEEESGAAGGYVSVLFRQQLVGWQIAPMRANASKQVRAGLAMEYSRNGQLKMLDAPWSELLTAELTIFPNGQHDDLVDAMCYAINAIAESVRLGSRLSVAAAPVVRI
jgi:predicted phage terminase large subunit-like protein